METTASAPPSPRVPFHLWLAGGFGLVCGVFGCLDFVLTNLRVPIYLAQIPPDMVDYVDALPAWAIIAWALAVGSTTVGTLLLLDRMRLAVHALAVSLLGLAAGQAYQFAVGVPAGMNTPGMWTITVSMWIVVIGLLLYAIRMRQAGVLR